MDCKECKYDNNGWCKLHQSDTADVKKNCLMNNFRTIEILFVTGDTKIISEGKYRPDLQTDNWHYWESSDGALVHARKEHVAGVTTTNVFNRGENNVKNRT